MSPPTPPFIAGDLPARLPPPADGPVHVAVYAVPPRRARLPRRRPQRLRPRRHVLLLPGGRRGGQGAPMGQEVLKTRVFLVIPGARLLRTPSLSGTLDASLRPGGGVWGCLGSKLWWGGTGIRTPDLLLESQECNHYATGAAPETSFILIFKKCAKKSFFLKVIKCGKKRIDIWTRLVVPYFSPVF